MIILYHKLLKVLLYENNVKSRQFDEPFWQIYPYSGD